MKEFLKKADIIAFNGIQAVDYYQKGDKVYFVKTNFFDSLQRCKRRDDNQKLKMDLIDNIKLFFQLKFLYIQVIKNNNLIRKLDDIK